jgi:hypothetical protein
MRGAISFHYGNKIYWDGYDGWVRNINIEPAWEVGKGWLDIDELEYLHLFCSLTAWIALLVFAWWYAAMALAMAALQWPR